jgi:hypothetical protein
VTDHRASSPDEAAHFAAELLRRNDHMALASAAADGKPWNSPVFYAVAPDFRLLWVSSKNTLHSKNIRARHEVALVIYETAPAEALYIEAVARQVGDDGGLEEAIEVVRTKEQPDRFTINAPDDVRGDAAWRIYEAMPQRAYLRVAASEEGQAVSERHEVDVALVRDDLARAATSS